MTMASLACTAEEIKPLPLRGMNTIQVLLVEDSPGDAFMVERMLRDASPRHEFDVTHVPRLADALSALDAGRFDAVLLDLNLLDIEGVASVAAMNAQTPQTPIIVYSGMDDPRLREEAFMCGARHYLVKGRESAWGLRHVIKQAIAHRDS